MVVLIITKINLNNKTMARPPKSHEDTKATFGAFAQNKVIELIGRKRCKEISENAVNKEYKRLIKKI